MVGDRLLVARNGLECRDLNSGQLLWNQPSSEMVPAVWTHQGRLYVILLKGDAKTFQCIDLLTGQVMWEQGSLIVENTQNLSLGVGGDFFAFYEGSQTKNAHVVLGTLSLQGMTQTVRVPQVGEVMNAMYPVIRDGQATIATAGGTFIYQCSDGQLLKREENLPSRRNGHFQLHEDKLLVVQDGRHGIGEFFWTDSSVGAISGPPVFTSPHYPTSAYSVAPMHFAYADGRIFIRGSDGLYCYDFRKDAENSNQTPVAVMASLPSQILSGTSLNLDATASSDADGTIVQTKWSFGDGAADILGATATRSFPQPGQLRITLTVTDNGGLSSHAHHWITVHDASSNVPPFPVVRVTPVTGNFPVTVQADATSSFDLDGGTLQFTWTWPDGQTTTGATTARQVDVSGVQELKLLVEDGQGGQTEYIITLRGHFTPPAKVMWQEGFTGLANGAKQDAGDTAWSSTGPGAVDQESWRSGGGASVWTSQPIAIGNLQDPAFSVALDTPDVGAFEESDRLKVSWSVDGGAFREGLNVSRISSVAPEHFAARVGAGNTLVIRVEALSSSSNEVYILDEVKVFDLENLVPTKPLVSVEPLGATTGSELGPSPVRVRFTREFLEEQPFTLHFGLGGDVEDADVTLSGQSSFGNGAGTIVFGAGVLAKELVLTPVDDGLTEGTESITVTLLEDAAYEVSPTGGTVAGDIRDAQTNYPPVLTRILPAGDQLSLANENETGSLEVSATDDRSASLSFAWSTLAGPGQAQFGAGTSAATTVTFPTYGVYDIRVTVTDGDFQSSFLDYTVSVTDALNTAPTAVISANPLIGDAPLLVAFDGMNSSDPDLDTLSYQWGFGNGASSTEAMPTHTFSTPGTYQVQLTVTDGRTGTDTVGVVVQVRPPAAPGNVIWQEGFGDLADGATSDIGDTAWTLDDASGKLSVLNGELHGSNLDAWFTWTSEAIDISGGVANFSLDVRTPSAQELETSDILRVGYILDGGPKVTAQEYVGDAIGNEGITFLKTGLAGETLQVVVEVINSSGAEHHMIDNITVRLEPTPVSFGVDVFHQWVAALLAGHAIDITKVGFAEKANGEARNGILFGHMIDSLDPADAVGKFPIHAVVTDAGESYLEIHFRRRPGGAGQANTLGGYVADQVQYIVECSTDLKDWDTGTDLLEEVGVDDNPDGSQIQKVRLKIPVDLDADGKEFLRVRLEEVP